MPVGGPRLGGTEIQLVGSGFGSCVGSAACFATTAASNLLLPDQVTTYWDRPLCIFREAPPSGVGGWDASARVLGTSVAAVETANLVVCVTPQGVGAFAFKLSGDPTTYEVTVDLALNGIVAESTRTGTPFSWYDVAVSHVTPLGGPAVSGSAVTIHGSGLLG